MLAGRPNAGKSSLFNALLGTERALVTEIPGTTRDAVEAHTDFLGWPVRLVDTAGLWDAPDRIDRLGVEVSRRYLAAADLVLLCVETGRRPGRGRGGDRGRARPTLLVRTKSDLDRPRPGGGLPVSAVSGDGLGELRRAAAERVFGDRISLADLEPALDPRAAPHGAGPGAGGAGRARSSSFAARGDAVLVGAPRPGSDDRARRAVGAVDIEEVLDRVFASFCVGK